MACGRPNSAAGQSHFFAPQRPGGKVGNSIEPPTPCGEYNLMGQPTSAAVDSPTVVSEVAASSASPSSRQHTVLPEFSAGFRISAAHNPAGQPYGEHASQCIDHQEQQQHICWQSHTGASWSVQQQQQEPKELPTQADAWAYYQQQYGTVQGKAADGWVEVQGAPSATADPQNPASGCKPLLQQQQAQLQSFSSDPSRTRHAAAQVGPAANTEAWQQQQQQTHARPAAAAEGSGQAGFDSMMRGLPPLRVGRCQLQSDLDGSHSAPAAGVNSMLGQQAQWFGYNGKAEKHHMRATSDTEMYGANGSGYSSYQASPSFTQQAQQQQQRHASYSTAAEAQGRLHMPHATLTTATAAAIKGQHDPHSASHSPTAALSQQMVSSLAVDSPGNSPVHNSTVLTHSQSYGQWQDHTSYQQPLQQSRQQANQGFFIPRTDDLVTDPLMDILMVQALGGSSSITVPTHHQQQQQQPPQCQWGQSQHLSIMDSTMQQGTGPTGHQQPQLSWQQHYQLAQQQPCSQQQPSISHMQQPGAAGACLPTSSNMPPPAASTQQRYSSNYLKMMDMLKNMPLVCDPYRKTWEEHMRQLKITLAPHESQEFSAYVRALWQSRESAAAAVGSTPASAAAGQAPRYACTGQGGKRLGPSRLSATVSHSLDDGTAAAVDAAAGEADALMRRSSMPVAHSMTGCTAAGTGMTPVPTISSAMALAPSVAFKASYPSQTLPVPANTAQEAQQLQQQISHVGGGAAAAASQLPITEGSGRILSASSPLAAGILYGDMLTARSAHCSSPLKRSQCSLGGPGLAAALSHEVAETMSPMKRSCAGLMEPPGFGVPLHGDLRDDDVAWAAVEQLDLAADDAFDSSNTFEAPTQHGLTLQQAVGQQVNTGEAAARPGSVHAASLADGGGCAASACTGQALGETGTGGPLQHPGSGGAAAAGISNSASDDMHHD